MDFANILNNNSLEKLQTKLADVEFKLNKAKSIVNQISDEQKQWDLENVRLQNASPQARKVHDDLGETLQKKMANARVQVRDLEREFSEIKTQVRRAEFDENKKSAESTKQKLETAYQRECDGLNALQTHRQRLEQRKTSIQATGATLTSEHAEEERSFAVKMKDSALNDGNLPSRPKKLEALIKQQQENTAQLQAINEALAQLDSDITVAEKAVHSAEVALTKQELFIGGMEYRTKYAQLEEDKQALKEMAPTSFDAEQKCVARLVQLGVSRGLIQTHVPDPRRHNV